jgi:hypothetical protein
MIDYFSFLVMLCQMSGRGVLRVIFGGGSKEYNDLAELITGIILFLIILIAVIMLWRFGFLV